MVAVDAEVVGEGEAEVLLVEAAGAQRVGGVDDRVCQADRDRLALFDLAVAAGGDVAADRERQTFREHVVEFEPGDRLVLYSDGLIEAVDDDGEPFGFERFEQTILSNGHLAADDIKKALLGAVKKFTRNRPPEDDQTLVVVAFEEMTADHLPPPQRLESVPVADLEQATRTIALAILRTCGVRSS
mgnify:CR=1 FL=1